MPHTPEPWELHYFTLDRIYIRKTEAGGRSIPIAMIVDTGELSPGELESNAELLVRAPQLLKFLCEFHSRAQAINSSAPMSEQLISGTAVTVEMFALASPLIEELKKAGVL